MAVTTDENGFLVDPEEWDEEIAIELACKKNIDLTDEHWKIIYMIRELYSLSGIVPELRTILKRLKETSDPDLSTRKYIYTLFPYGYGQQACRIAGMRLPRKLWLDV